MWWDANLFVGQLLEFASGEAKGSLHRLKQDLACSGSVLERELLRVRDHFTLIRDSYRKLANELITQLQLVDKLDSEVAQAPSGPAELHWLRGEQQSSDS